MEVHHRELHHPTSNNFDITVADLRGLMVPKDIQGVLRRKEDLQAKGILEDPQEDLMKEEILQVMEVPPHREALILDEIEMNKLMVILWLGHGSYGFMFGLYRVCIICGYYICNCTFTSKLLI